MKRDQWSYAVLLLVAVAALSVLTATPASAAPFPCNECTYIVFNGEVCDAVEAEEKGRTDCNSTARCILSGSECTGPSSGGGGGGGGGDDTGGGGAGCNTTGFCPAECFTCSGGGGRPRV